jgi:hypothetical protein
MKGNFKMINRQSFRQAVAIYRQVNPLQREGQAIFNVAADLFPNKPSPPSTIDCYHDDSNIAAFIDYLFDGPGLPEGFVDAALNVVDSLGTVCHGADQYEGCHP